MHWLAECHNAIKWGNSLRVDLSKAKNLGYLILIAIMTTFLIGLILFIVDPNIKTPSDGIWAAWVTMTHVGFGDVVPVSFLGRLLASALILLGLVFFSLFTALVSVALIGRATDTYKMSMREIELDSTSLREVEHRILDKLTRLDERIDVLEKRLSSSTRQDRPDN